MPDPTRLTIAERRTLVAELYQAGHTTRQIAERLGVSYQAIHQMLQRLDIPRHDASVRPHEKRASAVCEPVSR